MIVEKGKYYLYRHIRLDKNEPFYIGIARKTQRNHKSIYTEYKRAYNEGNRRNPIWQRIAEKTKYKVEILIECDNIELIKKKEQEFITLYGRIDKGTGTLANLTDGGDGIRNYKHTEETKKKIDCGS